MNVIILRGRLTAGQVTIFKQNFLRARGQFFQKKLDLLSSYDQGEFLRGYISLFKEKLTTMISQYQAVFGNRIDGRRMTWNMHFYPCITQLLLTLSFCFTAHPCRCNSSYLPFQWNLNLPGNNTQTHGSHYQWIYLGLPIPQFDLSVW